MTTPLDDLIRKAMQDAADKGRTIEVGWLTLRLGAVPLDASQAQVDAMRSMFFAGAKHLFDSIMVVLEPDAEPTANDLNRMSLIQAELEAFIDDYRKQHGIARPQGH